MLNIGIIYISMNARWLSNLCAYRQSEYRLQSAKRIIDIKIQRQRVLLKKYRNVHQMPVHDTIKSMQDVFLYEARAAKSFWKVYATLLQPWCGFKNRGKKEKDVVNVFLNIGYHHLTNTVDNIVEKHGITSALGILHEARNATSKPLAYDLVELFRSDIVDAEVLRFFRLKHRTMNTIRQSDIAQFIHVINNRLDTKHYLRDFKQCHIYRYYMELQVLKFIHAVNHNEAFCPIWLPSRHDSRCTQATLLPKR